MEGAIEGRDEKWEGGLGAGRWGEKKRRSAMKEREEGRCGTNEREEG